MADSMFCGACGVRLDTTATFCASCGVDQRTFVIGEAPPDGSRRASETTRPGDPTPSAQAAGIVRPSRRGVAASLLLLLGGGVLVLGVIGLAVAKNYEPSLENALTHEELLTPAAYSIISAMCWLTIVLGIISAVTGLVLLARQGPKAVLDFGQIGSPAVLGSRPALARTASHSRAQVAQSHFASWPRRAGAFVIDLLILSPLTVPLALVTSEPYMYLIVSIVDVGVVLGYGALTMLRPDERNGQTLGKQWLGIRVIRIDRTPVDFGTMALREGLLKVFVFAWLAIVTLYIATLVDYLWPLGDHENRALHDIWASTRVIDV